MDGLLGGNIKGDVNVVIRFEEQSLIMLSFIAVILAVLILLAAKFIKQL